MRPGVTRQLNPDVRLVNYPEVDDPNNPVLARRFANGRSPHASLDDDGVLRDRIGVEDSETDGLRSE